VAGEKRFAANTSLLGESKKIFLPSVLYFFEHWNIYRENREKPRQLYVLRVQEL
jgi:hypothetical protein